MPEKVIGKVVKFFSRIGVVAVKIEEGELREGDRIRIKGHTTDFEQVVESIQIENVNVKKAGAGDLIGIKVVEKARENDQVYLITEG